MQRLLPAFLACCLLTSTAFAQTREDKVRNDRKKVEAEGFWIYNDLPKGIAEAKKTGKPMFVILRCIPCVECVKLDDDLVNQDKRVRPLLEKFVCVRIISTNGLDLSLFQFDYDQSFAGFFLNADGTIYGRFGTRSHRTQWSDDVSIEGLSRALQGALDLHKEYPKNKSLFTAKKGPAPAYPSPEKYPTLKGKYGPKLNYSGKVVPSCIHCHQVGEAQREVYRESKEPIPEKILFSYPHPKALGLILDPRERATVQKVVDGSLAEKAGFTKGDVITRLGGQPLLSIADVQWVLHNTPGEGASLKAEVQQGGRTVTRTLELPKGWRRLDDISWRASSWGLRRMVTGGILMEKLTPEERQAAGIAEDAMALRIRHLGQYGPHAAAQNAGFRKGDIIVSFDGRADFKREADVFAHAVDNFKVGDRVKVEVLRGKKKLNLMLPMQK